jgi:uncharacterized protein YcgL (UPF0745 family)
MQCLCEIYKSKKQEELYLYIDKAAGFERVPQELLDKINCDKAIMTLLLTPERKLSRADVSKVLSDIEVKGYYLQLPPTEFVKREK